MAWWGVLLLCWISFFIGFFVCALLAANGKKSRREEEG